MVECLGEALGRLDRVLVLLYQVFSVVKVLDVVPNVEFRTVTFLSYQIFG